MAKKKRFFDVKISKKYGPSERQAIAEEVIEFIKKRTEKGLDKDNNKFPGYSREYKKSLEFKVAGKRGSKVNLRLTDEMLDSLDIVRTESGKLRIGYKAANKDLVGKVDGNVRGTYGNSSPIRGKKRDFLGIKKEDLNKILSDFPLDDQKKLVENVTKILTARELAEEALDGDE